MDDLALLVDFGSTYTKVLAVDLDKAEVIGRTQSPTTVEDNMLHGLLRAMEQLTLRGKPVDAATLRQARKLASSSAAGGLRIVAVGLVPDLTVEAARKAALGAGAKLVGSFGFELDEQALDDIEAARCDILLLVGGIDGGNKDVILHNARMLASRRLDMPFIVAGNRSVAAQVVQILRDSGKQVERTDNVLPELDRLVVEPTRACIRDIFMGNIVRAKGLEQAQDYLGQILMPTPMATLKAASLLAHGHGSDPGLGELMVVEIGGATTNVHSIAHGTSQASNTITRGLPEPYEMRTVEGDLGIRFNATTILESVGAGRVLHHAGAGLDAQALQASVQRRHDQVAFVPDSDLESRIDIALGCSAVEVAVERHAGTVKESWGVDGMVRIQSGKDLTALRTVIGTGGLFSHNPDAGRVLQSALMRPEAPFSLKPRACDFLIDRGYVLYGVGLLASEAPQAALSVARRHLVAWPAA